MESLQQIAECVMQFADAVQLDAKRAYGLRLAVDEVATNIIIHGYEGSEQQGDLAVCCDIGDDSLSITFEDTGSPFDPGTIAEPEGVDRPLEERQMGGLGVFLVRRNVDEWRYERKGPRNQNTLVIYRRRHPGDSA